MTDHRAEAVLREVGAHLDVPPPPPEATLTATVLARLDEPPPRHRPALLPRLVAAALALLAALGVAMAVSPEIRAAVLEFLRVGGVELNEAPPPVTPTETRVLLPGERAVTLDEAHEAADFPVRVPALLGDPEAVHLVDGTPPRMVSLLYDDVRVDQFEGGIAPLFEKFTHADDAVPTRVDGGQGVWLPRPHPVLYQGRDGELHEESARLAGTTLIWERDGLTYRVEGDLTHAQAVEIAESMAD